MNGKLKGYNLYGWQLDDRLSTDENFMDLCMIVTRSSKLKQGSMACILVNEPEGPKDAIDVNDAIISVANNMPLYGKNDSDIHAEIAAIGAACRNGQATENCTAYVTMPPCKRCFAALTVAGIRKIVTRHNPSPKIRETAMENNIEYITISNHAEQMARINTLVNGNAPRNKRKNHDTTDTTFDDAKKKISMCN